MNSVRSNSLSLKYQGFPPLGCQDIRHGKFEFCGKNSIPFYIICVKINLNVFTLKVFSYVFKRIKIIKNYIFKNLEIYIKMLVKR